MKTASDINEVDLKREDTFKNEDKCESEDDLIKEDDPKNEMKKD